LPIIYIDKPPGSAEIVKGTGISESPLNVAQTFTDPLCSPTV